MATSISLDRIVDNPFQSRTTYDRESIQSLAEEMKAEGVWGTVLQGRRTKTGTVELVFGHRRLRALRVLNVKTVPIEIVDLTDAQMALRSLEENLQREGLTDLEKADAVKKAVEIARKELRAAGQKESQAETEVAQRLGLSRAWVNDLCRISSGMPDKIRGHIGAGHLTGQTALRAKDWGGDAYAKTLAQQGKQAATTGDVPKPTHMTVQAMKKVVNAAPEPVRERLKDAIIAGEITTPAEAEQKARRLAAERTKREKPLPADLNTAIVGWTRRYRDWADQLKKELIPYLAYIEYVPASLVKPFQAAQGAFLETAQEAMFVEPKPAEPKVVKGQVIKPKALKA